MSPPFAERMQSQRVLYSVLTSIEYLALDRICFFRAFSIYHKTIKLSIKEHWLPVYLHRITNILGKHEITFAQKSRTASRLIIAFPLVSESVSQIKADVTIRILPWSFLCIVFYDFPDTFVSIWICWAMNSSCTHKTCFVCMVELVQLVNGKAISRRTHRSITSVEPVAAIAP